MDEDDREKKSGEAEERGATQAENRLMGMTQRISVRFLLGFFINLKSLIGLFY